MSTPLMIHFSGWFLLLICTIYLIGSIDTTKPLYRIALMFNRLLYLVLILSGIWMMSFTTIGLFIIKIIKLLLGIVTIGLIEMVLGKKARENVNHQYLLLLLSISLLVTSVVGLLLVHVL